MKLFDQNETNTGRQMCIDVAKVFAIIFMVAIHTIMFGGSSLDDPLSIL